MSDKQIRVLHVVQRMEAGGTQALLMNIYRNIDRSKVQFDFLVEYPDKEFYDDEIISMGGRVFYTNFRNDYNIIKFKKKLEEILKENPEYKIMHVHVSTIGYICFKIAKKYHINVRIAHAHNNSSVHDSKYILRNLLRKTFSAKSTERFACSESAGKFFFKDKEFNILKNAIDTDKFVYSAELRDKKRSELNIGDNIVIGNIGRLHEQKNQSFLIDIFKILKEKNENMKLLIIGKGPLENKLKEQVKKLDLENDVIFLGNRSDVNELYQAMDLFIFPSLFEGLGIVAIEAQASALPVLCSDQTPSEIEITPYIEKMSIKERSNTWADKAIELLRNNNRRGMKEEIIKAGFDIKSVALEMQEYYLNKYYEGEK